MNTSTTLQDHQDINRVAPTSGKLHGVLVEMLQSFRQPAVLLDAEGQILHSNATTPQPVDAGRGAPMNGAAPNPQEYPYRITFAAREIRSTLAVPVQKPASASDAVPLPPRLVKVARLVVSGFTDKQIASRTGLSFSTVRTYVRQIYRRAGVHTRVELVHASATGILDV